MEGSNTAVGRGNKFQWKQTQPKTMISLKQ